MLSRTYLLNMWILGFAIYSVAYVASVVIGRSHDTFFVEMLICAAAASILYCQRPTKDEEDDLE